MELAPVIKRMLSEFERALRTEAFNPATTTRQFTLAVSDAGQISWLPAFGRLIAAEMPRASLRVIGIDTYLSWGGPPSAEIDAAIATVSKSAQGEHIKPLCKETSVLVARRGHAIAGQRVNKKQVSALEHVEVQVAPGRGYHGLAELYANAGIERRVVMTVPTFVAAAAVVAATDFATTLPAGLVDVFRERFDLEVIKAHAPALTTPLYMIWHDRTHEDAAAQKFRSLIFRSYAQA
jgi:DNA-binding transcriptional LysR family regulator